MMQTISAKKVAPSINAAEMIMPVWMFVATSGWCAMLSTAAAPILAMPKPPQDDQTAADRGPGQNVRAAGRGWASAGVANTRSVNTMNAILVQLNTFSISCMKRVRDRSARPP